MTKLPDIWRESSFNLSSNPFRELARMQRRLDHLFGSLWSSNSANDDLMMMPSFLPGYDVEEADSHYVMSFDLPGVKKDNIKIELQDNQLTVSGERAEERDETGKGRYQSERFRGTFARSFTVPSGTRPEQIETEYKDGVLRIAIPKPEAARTQQVKIGEGKPGFWERLLTYKPKPQPQERRPSEKVA